MRLSRIVLASESPRRLELLRSLGFIVDVAASGYAEMPLPGVSPADLASYHAREKLRATLETHGRPIDVPVLAADTVVDLDGRPLGKPRDLADAARMLESLSGREHVVHTAFALAVQAAQLGPKSGRRPGCAFIGWKPARSPNTWLPASRWTKLAPTASKGAPRRW